MESSNSDRDVSRLNYKTSKGSFVLLKQIEVFHGRDKRDHLAGISIVAADRGQITPTPPSQLLDLGRTCFQLPIPVAQPALEPEPKIPGPFSDTPAPLRRFFAGFLQSAVARYPRSQNPGEHHHGGYSK